MFELGWGITQLLQVFGFCIWKSSVLTHRGASFWKMGGYKCPIKEPGRLASRRATLAQQLDAFKKRIRRKARTTMCEEDAEVFKASLSKLPRLRGLGISSHMATVWMKLGIPEKPGCEGDPQVTKWKKPEGSARDHTPAEGRPVRTREIGGEIYTKKRNVRFLTFLQKS